MKPADATRFPSDRSRRADRPSRDLARRLALADVPAPVRERAKALTLDGIACAIVGAQLPWSRLAVDSSPGSKGRASAA